MANLPASRHFATDEQQDALIVRDRRRVAPGIVGLPFLATGLYLIYAAGLGWRRTCGPALSVCPAATCRSWRS